MKLGLNLSFSVKRWMKPKELASLCSEFRIRHIQFTWDMVDPWWPENLRDPIAKAYVDAFQEKGMTIEASFGGLASYTYAHLLSPLPEVRAASVVFFKRAIDMTTAMGVKTIGTPIGGMDYEDSRDPVKRGQCYQTALEHLRELARYGKEKGLREIQIEPTPLATEFPHNIAASKKLMMDLSDSAIPIRLLIDWGHATYKPLLGEEADMALWLRELKPWVTAIHLQQTDGMGDRHWDFTHGDGMISPEFIRKVTLEAGAEDIIQYLEVVPAFEDFDDKVLEGMHKTVRHLHDVFDKPLEELP